MRLAPRAVHPALIDPMARGLAASPVPTSKSGGFDVRAGGAVEVGGNPLAAFAVDLFGIVWVS